MICALNSRTCLWGLLAVAGLACIEAQEASAQGQKAAARPVQETAFREQINGNTIGVLGGTLNGTYIRIVDDVAKVIDDGDNLRVMPIVGKGGGQNLRDLLYLKGVDLAVISALSLLEYKDQQHFSNLSERICFVSVLYPEEVHILSDKVRTVNELSGKVVAYQGSGSKLAGDGLFEALGVKPAKTISMNMFDAVDKMKTGEIDALVYLAGKPISGVDRLEGINKNLRFVEVPYTDALVDKLFLPTFFTKEEYPTFVGDQARRETVAAGVLLIAYNWRTDAERARRVEKFTTAFLGRIKDIVSSKNSHPKWQEVNLNARVPNWKRCPAAQNWMELAQQREAAAAKAQPARAGVDDRVHQEKLFQEFLKWQKERQQR